MINKRVSFQKGSKTTSKPFTKGYGMTFCRTVPFCYPFVNVRGITPPKWFIFSFPRFLVNRLLKKKRKRKNRGSIGLLTPESRWVRIGEQSTRLITRGCPNRPEPLWYVSVRAALLPLTLDLVQGDVVDCATTPHALSC